MRIVQLSRTPSGSGNEETATTTCAVFQPRTYSYAQNPVASHAIRTRRLGSRPLFAIPPATCHLRSERPPRGVPPRLASPVSLCHACTSIGPLRGTRSRTHHPRSLNMQKSPGTLILPSCSTTCAPPHVDTPRTRMDALTPLAVGIYDASCLHRGPLEKLGALIHEGFRMKWRTHRGSTRPPRSPRMYSSRVDYMCTCTSYTRVSMCLQLTEFTSFQQPTAVFTGHGRERRHVQLQARSYRP